MEAELRDLLTQIEQYKDTHPNISHLWRSYLNAKFEGLKTAMRDCRSALAAMESLHDLSQENLVVLYTLASLETQ